MVHGPNSLAPVYFSTAAEIFQWQPSSANPLMVATVPLAARIVTNEVRMLVGLDNGPWAYWSEFDANPQGGHRGNVYNFQYWQYVDAMYYYVHTLAAVPPVMWINAAHRNGVKVFSAVTADYEGGGNQFNALFSSPDIAAQQLYRLAATYGFDGWMVDVENGAVPNDNVRQAMQLLKTMLLPNGQIIEVGYYEAGHYTINDQTYPFLEAGTFFQSDYTAAQGLPVHTYTYLSQLGQAAARFATYWTVYVYSYPGDDHNGLYNGYAWLDVKGFFAQLGQALNARGNPQYYQSLGIYAPDWTMYGGLSSTSAPLPSRDLDHAGVGQ
jgi:endo-beta-N-acetylglucosaminidase D